MKDQITNAYLSLESKYAIASINDLALWMQSLVSWNSILGIEFHNYEHLCHALMHTSFVKENLHLSITKLDANERLEFLGDSVLGFSLTTFLYHKYNEFKEGELTRVRSHFVGTKKLAAVARKLGLERWILLGEGALKQKIFEQEKTLANTVEALIGAVYLDRGFTFAHSFVLSLLGAVGGPEGAFSQEVAKALKTITNIKSDLQQLGLKYWGEMPEYRAVSLDKSAGFRVSLLLGGEMEETLEGPNKHALEKKLATRALKKYAHLTTNLGNE